MLKIKNADFFITRRKSLALSKNLLQSPRGYCKIITKNLRREAKLDIMEVIKRILSFILAFFTLVCGAFTRLSIRSDEGEAPAVVFEDAEELPAEAVGEEELVRVSDRLVMPRITAAAELKTLSADLNEARGGYEVGSLMTEAFESVFDKIVVFRAGSDTAYALGSPVETDACVIQTETGYYIPLTLVRDVLGGDYEERAEGAVLAGGEMTVTAADGRACLAENGSEAAPEEIELLDDGGLLINVKDAAKLFGLTEYHTDAGLVFFSVGSAFDPVKGYYVAEEAEKLWLDGEKAEEYSANMFVDIPNIIGNGERSVTAYSYPELDINANVTAYAVQGVGANVGLGPAIVAGQGEHANNYTVVRVFDVYQTLHTQFSAYPATVRGGVQVAAASAGGRVAILTAPYMDADVSELRCYDANGSFLFTVSPTGEAPFAIAAGAFLGGEDVFAVTRRAGLAKSRVVEFFSAADGSLIETRELPVDLAAGVLLSADRVSGDGDALLVWADNNVLAYSYRGGELTELDVGLRPCNGVFASAFGGYWVTGDAKDVNRAFSEVTEYAGDGKTTINVGAKENLFFTTGAKKDSSYVKPGTFWHLRMEFGTAAHNNTAPGDTSSIRVNDISSFTVSPGSDVVETHDTQYNMWEPCATHRWNQTGGMRNLINYVDPDTGLNGYATLTKENERTDYVELGSSYFNGTYAPYIEAMDRFNFWSRRTYLQSLAELYRDAPEYTAAVSPVHEHEIDSGAGSVGDYNPKMIDGFRLYLKELYGTIDNVNGAFGTAFASFDELDAPRNAGRGEWDRYPADASDANPYFNQWSIYNRSIVSQRIVESYREALLAGFPPELIKAHQIPEGDAVSGFLGEADTRISPIDVVLADGTGYGGTRYFTWYRDKNNFLALARDSGHHNITLGEYSAISAYGLEAYAQLKYLFDNGVMFTHLMYWPNEDGTPSKEDQRELAAIERLQNLNTPRSASSGGTGGVAAYTDGERAFNIVEIGSKKNSAGLLKSVNADGSFEGTVYLQPFHAAAVAVDLARGVTASGTGRLRVPVTGRKDADGKAMTGLNYGDTVDVRVKAKPLDEAGTLTIRVWHEGVEDEAASYTFEVRGGEEEYRYCFKNQINLEDCSVTITYRDVEIADADVTLIYERTARRYYGETSPQAHVGGVSFDLLPE